MGKGNLELNNGVHKTQIELVDQEGNELAEPYTMALACRSLDPDHGHGVAFFARPEDERAIRNWFNDRVVIADGMITPQVEAASVDRVLRSCQRGVANSRGEGVSAANDILAQCYGTIGSMRLEILRLRSLLEDREARLKAGIEGVRAARQLLESVR